MIELVCPAGMQKIKKFSKRKKIFNWVQTGVKKFCIKLLVDHRAGSGGWVIGWMVDEWIDGVKAVLRQSNKNIYFIRTL
jgi:hypothetical protein